MLLAAAQSVHAQPRDPLGDCDSGTAGTFEIGLRITSGVDFRVTVTDARTGALLDSRIAYADQEVEVGCQYAAHVGEPSSDPDEPELPARVPLHLLFESVGTTPVESHAYTYFLCRGAGGFVLLPRGHHGFNPRPALLP